MEVVVGPAMGTYELLTYTDIRCLCECLSNTIALYDGWGLKTDEDIITNNQIRQDEALAAYRKKFPKQEKVVVKSHLYVIEDIESNSIKVGRSKNPNGRIKSLSNANPNKLEFLKIYEKKGELEERVHEALKEAGLHIRGEWFKNTEDALDIISEIVKDDE